MEGQSASMQPGVLTPEVNGVPQPQPPVEGPVPFNPETQMVNTKFGPLPFKDLRYTVEEVDRAKDVLVFAWEWFYIGSDEAIKAQAGDALVRRDVAVTILIGQKLQGQQGA